MGLKICEQEIITGSYASGLRLSGMVQLSKSTAVANSLLSSALVHCHEESTLQVTTFLGVRLDDIT